jgi:plastocyanin
MRLRGGYLLLAVVLGTGAASLPAMVGPAIAGSITSPETIEAENKPGSGIYGEETHAWHPSQVAVNSGGVVKFSNPYTTTYHGLKFTGGTAGTTPSCTGIPQKATEPSGAFHWEGECTFSKAGTYTFICTVHPTEMKGTITVTNGEPSAITEAATPVTEHEATLKGTVNPEGKATKYFFKWGTTGSYGQETGEQPAGEGTVGAPVFAKLSGLAPGTTYHFKLVAKNEKGPAEGEDQTFTTTSPPGPPTATTGEATSVSETEATLKGTINPDGKPTKSFFEWGTSSSYGLRTAEVPAGEDHTNHAASATLMALSPGTVYHFRLVAKNSSSETVPGVDQTLKTAPLPLPSPPANPSPPTATSSSTTPVLTIVPMAPIELISGLPLVGAPSLHSSQHGSSVRGSVQISKAGVGGRLEVDLLTNSASLAMAGHSAQTRIGRLLRSSLKAGSVSFTVPLTAKAKSALRRHHHLALTVRIVLTPVDGAAVTVTKSVVLRA